MSEVAANLARALLRTPRDVALALDTLDNGSSPQVKAVLEAMLSQPNLPWPRDCPLTPREAEVMRHLAAGMTYGQAAAAMGITSKTIRSHVHHFCKKTGTVGKGSAQAIIVCYREGWVV